jgi:hypothetical protein
MVVFQVLELSKELLLVIVEEVLLMLHLLHLSS